MFVETVEVDDQLEVCEFRSHDIGLVRGAGARTYFTLPYRDPCYHGQIRVPRARNSAQVTDYKPYVVCNFHQAVISIVLISSMCTIFNINLRASEKRKRNEENLLRIRNSKRRKSSEGKMDFIYDGNIWLERIFSLFYRRSAVVSETIASGIIIFFDSFDRDACKDFLNFLFKKW